MKLPRNSNVFCKKVCGSVQIVIWKAMINFEYKNNDKTSIIINDSLLKLNLLLKLSVLFDTL